VLRGVSLKIKQNSTVALVGTSGSGKSSLLALLCQFYEPNEGQVLVNGVELRNRDLSGVRGKMALVSQDAVLFKGSVRWNVKLGATSQAQATEEAVRAACHQADILDFIDSLPQGFDTDVGLKGSQLSGGQRQRICIARALLRDPEVLLLDEASSALDAKSEAAVQASLDKAARGRTTLLVAHRLSTVQRADYIHVFEDGRVVESGTHTELIQRKGRYREVSLIAESHTVQAVRTDVNYQSLSIRSSSRRSCNTP
jgi:ATP-binding cassette, subfamily B (MDR/TAP), member 1